MQKMAQQCRLRIRILKYSFSIPRHDLGKHQQAPPSVLTVERLLRFKETGQRADTVYNVLVDQRRIEAQALVQASPPGSHGSVQGSESLERIEHCMRTPPEGADGSAQVRGSGPCPGKPSQGIQVVEGQCTQREDTVYNILMDQRRGEAQALVQSSSCTGADNKLRV